MKWLAFAYALFQLDSRTKRRAEEKLPKNGKAVPVAGGKLLLQRVSNKGMAGGVLSDKSDKIRYISTAVGAVIGLNFLSEIPRKKRYVSKAASAMIAAGAAGNLYDRWTRGSVTDFLRFGEGSGILSKVVFNVADVLILIGGVLLIPIRLFSSR